MAEKFDMRVLRAISELGLNAYGVTIREQMGKHGRAPMSYAGIYMAIGRLEEKGLIFTFEGDAKPERGGRRKRMCRVSADGELALKLLATGGLS